MVEKCEKIFDIALESLPLSSAYNIQDRAKIYFQNGICVAAK